MSERALIFFIDAADEARAREISLAGVIDNKLAKGDELEMQNPATVFSVDRKTLLALVAMPDVVAALTTTRKRKEQ